MCKHISQVYVGPPTYRRVVTCKKCGINLTEKYYKDKTNQIKRHQQWENHDLNKAYNPNFKHRDK